MATASNGTTSPGRKIRRQRQILRLTQQKLADMVGADRSAVSAWERGLHFPQRFAGAVEHALGISLTEEPPPPPVLDPRLLELASRLTDAEREALIQLLLRRRDEEPPQSRSAARG